MNLKALLSLKNVIVDKPCDRLEKKRSALPTQCINRSSQPAADKQVYQ